LRRSDLDVPLGWMMTTEDLRQALQTWCSPYCNASDIDFLVSIIESNRENCGGK
jgi:hypothetical protein